MNTPSQSGTFIMTAAPPPAETWKQIPMIPGANAGCAAAMFPPGTQVFTGTIMSSSLCAAPTACPGCGTAYLTCAVNPMYPHNFAECAAYKRGFADGLAAAKREMESK